MSRVLYIVASAAPPVLDLAAAVSNVRAEGWDPCVTVTPTAARWLAVELGRIEAAAGRPVRVVDRLPGEPRPFPAADAVIAAPLTFNSLNKIALGISDNVALGTLNEAVGASTPLVLAPYFKADLMAHPRYAMSMELLTACGVQMVTGEDGFQDVQGLKWWARALKAVTRTGL